MAIKVDVELCTGCDACVEASPVEAIILTYGEVEDREARECNCVVRVDENNRPRHAPAAAS